MIKVCQRPSEDIYNILQSPSIRNWGRGKIQTNKQNNTSLKKKKPKKPQQSTPKPTRKEDHPRKPKRTVFLQKKIKVILPTLSLID